MNMTKEQRREKFLREHPEWSSESKYPPREGNMKMRLLDIEERRRKRLLRKSGGSVESEPRAAEQTSGMSRRHRNTFKREAELVYARYFEADLNALHGSLYEIARDDASISATEYQLAAELETIAANRKECEREASNYCRRLVILSAPRVPGKAYWCSQDCRDTWTAEEIGDPD
jgi:hypothetical protein